MGVVPGKGVVPPDFVPSINSLNFEYLTWSCVFRRWIKINGRDLGHRLLSGLTSLGRGGSRRFIISRGCRTLFVHLINNIVTIKFDKGRYA